MRSGVVIAAWLTASAGLFWHFEGRYLLPVPPVAARADANARREASQGEVTLLNVWDPDCPCARFAEPQVRRLADRFAGRVRIVTLVRSRLGDEGPALNVARQRGVPGELRPDLRGRSAAAFGVPSAPAAVVLRADGSLAYIGSYNVGRWCADPATALAEQAVEAVLAGRRPRVERSPFFGCATD